MSDTVAAQLGRMIALFDGHPERWIKLSYAKDKKGCTVDPTSKNAVCWCLIGAAYKTRIDGWIYENVRCLTTHTSISFGYLTGHHLNDNTNLETVMEMLLTAQAHAKGAGI